jgi:4-hydroxy-tetrahydrodipicolinate reductase
MLLEIFIKDLLRKKMKIAQLGNGKTGSYISTLAKDHEVVIFNTSTGLDLETLQKCDLAISFLPGEVFLESIPVLLEAGIPVVTGSTGFHWPKNIKENLLERKQVWVRASNFSLGMNIVREMIYNLKNLKAIQPEASIKIHEIHHVNKLDAPSGTALSWEEWIGGADTITSDRVDDVVGVHELSFEVEGEVINLSHNAKDRSIFARGALWVAEYINENNMVPGLYEFHDLLAQGLR